MFHLQESNIDFPELFNQKQYLVILNSLAKNSELESVINFLDYVLDTAEDQGYFKGVEYCQECGTGLVNDICVFEDCKNFRTS